MNPASMMAAAKKGIDTAKKVNSLVENAKGALEDPSKLLDVADEAQKLAAGEEEKPATDRPEGE